MECKLIPTPYISHLHSTMLLLKCLPYTLQRSMSVIYIPLCYYLNSFQYQGCRKLENIYIPLCYYLNNENQALRLAASHLHSTMLLLKFISFITSLPSKVIYIPLCYYLNAFHFHGLFANAEFTFHYATT